MSPEPPSPSKVLAALGGLMLLIPVLLFLSAVLVVILWSSLGWGSLFLFAIVGAVVWGLRRG